MKPTVFIGSTKEGRNYAEAVVSQLGSDVLCHPWCQGVFEIGGNTQNSLLRAISDCDFAVFILTADDITVSRGVDFFSPRDNLIFEAGISFGTFEPGRTFLIPEKRDGFKIPSDLNGFIIAPPFESTDNADDAMKVPVSDIRRRINESSVETM